jgi:hypothetical protein
MSEQCRAPTPALIPADAAARRLVPKALQLYQEAPQAFGTRTIGPGKIRLRAIKPKGGAILNIEGHRYVILWARGGNLVAAYRVLSPGEKLELVEDLRIFNRWGFGLAVT